MQPLWTTMSNNETSEGNTIQKNNTFTMGLKAVSSTIDFTFLYVQLKNICWRKGKGRKFFKNM